MDLNWTILCFFWPAANHPNNYAAFSKVCSDQFIEQHRPGFYHETDFHFYLVSLLPTSNNRFISTARPAWADGNCCFPPETRLPTVRSWPSLLLIYNCIISSIWRVTGGRLGLMPGLWILGSSAEKMTNMSRLSLSLSYRAAGSTGRQRRKEWKENQDESL